MPRQKLGPAQFVMQTDEKNFVRGLKAGQKEIRRLQKETENLRKRFRESNKASANLAKTVRGAFGAAAAVAGAATLLRGAFDISKEAGELSVDLERIASAAGTTVTRLTALNSVLAESGGNLDTTADLLQTISERIADAADGTTTYVELFQRLGIAIRNQDGTLRAGIDVLLDLQDAAKTLGTAQRNLAFTDLLGDEGARVFHDLLRENATALRDQVQAAEASQQGMDALVAESRRTDAAFRELTEGATRLALEFTAAFGPEIRALIGAATKATERLSYYMSLIRSDAQRMREANEEAFLQTSDSILQASTAAEKLSIAQRDLVEFTRAAAARDTRREDQIRTVQQEIAGLEKQGKTLGFNIDLLNRIRSREAQIVAIRELQNDDAAEYNRRLERRNRLLQDAPVLTPDIQGLQKALNTSDKTAKSLLDTLGPIPAHVKEIADTATNIPVTPLEMVEAQLDSLRRAIQGVDQENLKSEENRKIYIAGLQRLYDLEQKRARLSASVVEADPFQERIESVRELLLELNKIDERQKAINEFFEQAGGTSRFSSDIKEAEDSISRSRRKISDIETLLQSFDPPAELISVANNEEGRKVLEEYRAALTEIEEAQKRLGDADAASRELARQKELRDEALRLVSVFDDLRLQKEILDNALGGQELIRLAENAGHSATGMEVLRDAISQIDAFLNSLTASELKNIAVTEAGNKILEARQRLYERLSNATREIEGVTDLVLPPQDWEVM